MADEATARWVRECPVARRPTLFAALLSGDFARYARYRLRYLAALTLLSTLLHVVEIDLLTAAFPFQELLPLIAYRVATAAVTPWWWGALEQLRQEVREHARRRRFTRATRRIEAWVGLGSWLGAAAPLLMGAWLSLDDRPFAQLHLYDVYAVCCALRLGVELPVRAYHSGLFAWRRVYRPFWSVAAPTLVEGSSLVLLWFWLGLGVWAFPAALLVGTFVRQGLALYFTRRAYLASPLDEPSFTRALRSGARVGRAALSQAGVFAVASSTAQLDQLLILLLVTQPERPGAAGFALVYYVLGPLMGTAHKWCRVFYYDLSRLSLSAHGFLRARLERSLRRLAWWTGLGVAAATAAVASWLFPSQVGHVVVALVPLFVARSHFALSQLLSFSYLRMRALAWLAAIVLGAMLVLSQTRAPAHWVVLDVSWILALAAWVAARQGRRAGADDLAFAGVFRWLSSLAEVRVAVRVHVAQVDRRLVRVAAARAALSAAYPSAAVTQVGRASLLCWWPAQDAPSCVDLQAATGGVLCDLQQLEAPDGATLLREAETQSLWPEPLRTWLSSAPEAAEPLRRACRAALEGAVEICARGRVRHPPRDWPQPAQAQALLHAVAAEARGGGPSGGAAVLVYAPGGVPQWGFALPERGGDYAELRAAIRARSAQDSIAQAWRNRP